MTTIASRYAIKDVFVTLQGEGARAGTRAVFVRSAGCNLWDGLAHHRERGKGACAAWCDTDFFKGEVLGLVELEEKMAKAWGASPGPRGCVLTGGEPLLQVNLPLLQHLKAQGWYVAVETNGTVLPKPEAWKLLDWICVSPKKGGLLAIPPGSFIQELKVVLPGGGGLHQPWTDSDLHTLAQYFKAAHYFVQAEDVLTDLVPERSLLRGGDDVGELHEVAFRQHLARCLAFIDQNPGWRLSVQTQKHLAIS